MTDGTEDYAHSPSPGEQEISDPRAQPIEALPSLASDGVGLKEVGGEQVPAQDYDPAPESQGHSSAAEVVLVPPNEGVEAEHMRTNVYKETGSSLPSQSPETGYAVRAYQSVRKNYGTVIGVLQETVRRMVDSHELRPEYIAECVNVFAPPQNLEELRTGLLDRRVVVLSGSRGTGRHTCAVWLLQDIKGLKLREVRREPGDNFVVDDLASEDHVGWLLDLRADGDLIQYNLGRTLISSKQLLENSWSYLAVVIRPDLWDQVKAGGEDVAIPLVPPRGTEVVKRRLTREKPALTESEAVRWSEYPELIRHLEPLPPLEAVDWASAIRAEHFTPLDPAVRTDNPDELTDETLLKKCANVIRARSDWREDLLTWNMSHPDSYIRNFMLATAVLEDSPGEEVFLAAQQLAKILRAEMAEARGLSGPGILEMVSKVDAHLSSNETVRFDRSGYADAVLEYFWADRMHLRESFISWMNSLAINGKSDITDSIAERLGKYVLSWSIRQNKLDSIEKLIASWACDKRFIAAAEALLTGAGLDSSLGRAVRDRMLTWAKSEEEEAKSLKLTVARACKGPLGTIYPKVMLLRLGYIAGTDDPEVANAVRDAVRALWVHPKVRERIQTDIATWYSSGDPAKMRASRRTFAALARLIDVNGAPLLLANHAGEGLSSDKARSFLVEGWRCLLDEPVPTDETVDAFVIWMDAAVGLDSSRDTLCSALADAVYRSIDEDFNDRRFSTLSDLLYTWQPAGGEPTPRTALREYLLNYVKKLDPLRHPRVEPSLPTDYPNA